MASKRRNLPSLLSSICKLSEDKDTPLFDLPHVEALFHRLGSMFGYAQGNADVSGLRKYLTGDLTRLVISFARLPHLGRPMKDLQEFCRWRTHKTSPKADSSLRVGFARPLEMPSRRLRTRKMAKRRPKEDDLEGYPPPPTVTTPKVAWRRPDPGTPLLGDLVHVEKWGQTRAWPVGSCAGGFRSAASTPP
ncbi:hypothetical protein AAG570_009876 [Ranatra chinensis]|uniref:Uncharacterized protein n=1 Tax=Ranatra chinensis TaxID=642074 RepID=A0ABD0YSF9_9HEMI